MRALLWAALLALAAPSAAATACGVSATCQEVVFVLVARNPTGGQLVSFYAIGGAPGEGAVVAKALQSPTGPVRCTYDSSLCQTPRAAQTPIRPGDCLDVAVAVLVGEPAEVEVRFDGDLSASVRPAGVDVWTYCA